jgi:malto-oligosyltrehalose trehalohydrolase
MVVSTDVALGGIDGEQLHGSHLSANGDAIFRLWAPAHSRIQLSISGHSETHAMRAAHDGWHEAMLPSLQPGTRYEYVLPDGAHVPDPASHFQPDGVRGPSELIDPRSYRWRVEDWAGRSWSTAVLYQLHVGTFTRAGTFEGVIGKLDHLVELGVTALQLMPIGAFAGHRNWGYDGVFPYACHADYGRPDDLKRLVDEAHARGLMVMLDVVYNHFGPEGNLLSQYAPAFFTERHKTPWGAAINFDGSRSRAVRDFFIGNAVRWVKEFRVDGLRLDAVHAIIDDSEPHLLAELAERVRQSARGRAVHLVLENEENAARWLRRGATARPLSYTAQWNDDVHHVLHTAATGESAGYYADYVGDTDKLGRALAEGFCFQGELMRFRGSRRGERSAFLPPDAFISFIQNHDQIGNRALGERIDCLAPPEARRAVAAIYLLLPQIPMLFMGEEWSARQPFPFFCDFHGELAEAVRKGRCTEFSHLPEFSDPDRLAKIPDPLSKATFDSAVLDWSDPERPEHAAVLEWYRRILAVRRVEIIPRIADIGAHAGRYIVRGPGVVTVQWRCENRVWLQLDANLSAQPSISFDRCEGRVVWIEGECEESATLPAWAVRWTVRDG